jgi:hypothetical protein
MQPRRDTRTPASAAALPRWRVRNASGLTPAPPANDLIARRALKSCGCPRSPRAPPLSAATNPRRHCNVIATASGPLQYRSSSRRDRELLRSGRRRILFCERRQHLPAKIVAGARPLAQERGSKGHRRGPSPMVLCVHPHPEVLTKLHPRRAVPAGDGTRRGTLGCTPGRRNIQVGVPCRNPALPCRHRRVVPNFIFSRGNPEAFRDITFELAHPREHANGERPRSA